MLLMAEYLKWIDTNAPGPRNDVTPLFANYEAFLGLVEDLAKPFDPIRIDRIAGIDALGFILGTALALHLGKGFLAIRKGGKLPFEVDQVALVDYTGARKTLELRRGIIHPGERILLVDEWIETGAQAQAAASLIEFQGGVVAGIAAINIDTHPKTRLLQARYTCHAVWWDGG
jgi:adenine phosphoribosyltransferase